MPHVAFVPFTGLRVREGELLTFGMKLPGLRERAAAISELPSLGLLTLAGMLPEDWTCSYHPSAASPTLVNDVLANNPTIVAVSALTASAIEAYRFCDELRDAGVATVIGGLHATTLPEESAQHATSVCVGDGEATWHEILGDAANDKLQSIYRQTQSFNLANSPQPNLALLGERQVPRWTLQTQRGCPFACEFCAASRLLGPPRFKPASLIEQELAEIKRLDPSPWIELADDNTFAAHPAPLELLDVIGDAKVKYFTESDWRIAQQPELVKKLAESGCVQVLVGLESLAFRYPGMGSKQFELDQMSEAIDIIQDAGIVVNGCFILGADGETNQSLDRLIEYVARSSLAEVQVTLQTPFPGTQLFDRMQQSGRLRNECDWSHYTLFDVVFEPDTMTATELEQGFRRVMTAVFSESESQRRTRLRREVWTRNRRKK